MNQWKTLKADIAFLQWSIPKPTFLGGGTSTVFVAVDFFFNLEIPVDSDDQPVLRVIGVTNFCFKKGKLRPREWEGASL
jgi:hypothetical protein